MSENEAAMNTEPAEAPRVVLVGESNPYGADPHYALYPLPANASGGRLARILGFPSPRQYLRAFPHRVNLLVGNKWSAPAARAAADELLASLPVGSGLALLGAKVSAAFGVDYKTNVFEPRFMQVGEKVLRGFWVAVLPHPSGLNRVWASDPLAATRARDAVRSLCEKVREQKGEEAVALLFGKRATAERKLVHDIRIDAPGTMRDPATGKVYRKRDFVELDAYDDISATHVIKARETGDEFRVSARFWNSWVDGAD